MAEKLKILAISGSLRSSSHNTALLNTVAGMAVDDCSVEIERLKGIPVYDGDDEQASGVPPIVMQLAQKIRAADGVIIATPEYNFSIPGGLKNATDWISRVTDQPFKNKAVGILGAALGPLGTGRSQYHLRQNLVGLEALTMNKPEVFVGAAGSKFDDQGKLVDKTTQSILEGWIAAYVAWVRRHARSA